MTVEAGGMAANASFSAAVAELASKVAAVDSAAFEAATDASGYGTTQQAVLDALSVTLQTNNTSGFDYWKNIVQQAYVHLPQEEKNKYDSATFTQGPTTYSQVPTFGNAGILGYWAEQASEAAAGVKRAITGDTTAGEKPSGMNWKMIGIAVAVLLILFFVLR